MLYGSRWASAFDEGREALRVGEVLVGGLPGDHLVEHGVVGIVVGDLDEGVAAGGAPAGVVARTLVRGDGLIDEDPLGEDLGEQGGQSA